MPALAAQRLFGLYQGSGGSRTISRRPTRRSSARISRLPRALIATLDARDRYTAGHSAAVAIYARDIARRMGLPTEIKSTRTSVDSSTTSARSGFRRVCSRSLARSRSRSAARCRSTRRSASESSRTLTTYAEIATIVRIHHERIDGQGYPDGLSGDAIPLISRIIAVADAYNAMTSDRPYRDAMPSRVARLRLAQAVESQFDTTVVAAFEAILAGADEDYRLAKRRDFLEFAQSTYEFGAELAAFNRRVA